MFRSGRFKLSATPPEGACASSSPLGRDCATMLMSELIRRGALLEFHEPIEGGDGWVVELEFENNCFSLLVQWQPVGRPPVDYWVIQVHWRKGIVPRLLRRPDPVGLQHLCDTIQEIVCSDPMTKEVTWMTDTEHYNLSLRGIRPS